MRRIGAGRQLEVCSMSVVCIYVREEKFPDHQWCWLSALYFGGCARKMWGQGLLA